MKILDAGSYGVICPMIKQGFQLTSLQNDDRFLMSKAKEEVEAVRNAINQSDSRGDST